ncbi:MAG: protein translocase subunit SecD [Bdellovibrionales bacterium]|nr:protein translocase subunit SecD [Bdellovibrionales bacterium]
MDKVTRYKFYGCILLALATFWLLSPTVWSISHPDADANKMPGWMPNTAMKLGLDLQGGIHMVMGVDLDKVVRDQLASYGRMMEKEGEKENIVGLKSHVPEGKFELEIDSPSKEVKDRAAAMLQKNFGSLTFVGESDNTLVARMSSEKEDEIRQRAWDQSIATIRNRIDEFGVAEPIITRKGDNQILVQFPGAKEPERLKNLIGQTAQLSFQIVHDCQNAECLGKQQADLMTKIKVAEEKGKYNRDTFKRLSEYRAKLNEDLKGQLPADTILTFEREKDVNVNNSNTLRPFLLSTKHTLSGEYIENADVVLNKSDRLAGMEMPEVSFQMNVAGTPLLGALTTEFQNHYMAIVLDGVVKSAPQINSPIPSGSGRITLGRGSFDEMLGEARDLSIVLRAGAMPATIEIQEERTIGPSLGLDAIHAGKNALALTVVLVFTFMAIYYGFSGIIANIVTLINIGLIVAILGIMGATLTLPGIAGIVLTISMGVDALIIIFERMREELRAGRNRKQIVSLGFDHAFATILDSNVTTAIGAFVLLEYGTGSVRGFALTLLVGITVNVFMATFYTKALFNYFLSKSTDAHPITVGLSKKELVEATA